ncbi:hypothetical protein FQR65_LT03097 [Abscondita terminalis]|nr:hypothetical protein FQR65_LT03097 [Abscondita terminalis]
MHINRHRIIILDKANYNSTIFQTADQNGLTHDTNIDNLFVSDDIRAPGLTLTICSDESYLKPRESDYTQIP